MPATALHSDLPTRAPTCSVIVPVYRNEENISELVARLLQLNRAIEGGIEAVCVVDGSPDASYAKLAAQLPLAGFSSQLILLSRNFGSFAAIREGLKAANGEHFAVMAADLQEPATLTEEALAALRNDECDVALGTRMARADPWFSRFAAALFWGSYRRFVQRDLPPGGIDVFACNRAFRDHLLAFGESNSSLVGQILWLGFRRKFIPYTRVERQHGKSAWTFGRKIAYLLDSIYSFSDLPIRLFLFLGVLGIFTSVALGLAVVVGRISGNVAVPGYAATVITVLFFSGLNLFGLGIIGSYVWRAYENTKARPLSVVMRGQSFDGNGMLR